MNLKHCLVLALSLPLLSVPAIAHTVVPKQSQQAIAQVVMQRLTARTLPADANPHVGRVFVVQGYALSQWFLGEGGEMILKQNSDGSWAVVTGGGGALDAPQLVQAGVPQPIAIQLIQQFNSL